MYDILMIQVDFCGNFPWFRLIFCYPDPDPADQNETDPNGSGSILYLTIEIFKKYYLSWTLQTFVEFDLHWIKTHQYHIHNLSLNWFWSWSLKLDQNFDIGFDMIWEKKSRLPGYAWPWSWWKYKCPWRLTCS